MRVALLTLVIAAACGGKKEPDPPVTGSGSGSTIAAVAGDVPVVDPGTEQDFVAMLVAANKPALVGPFAPVPIADYVTIGDVRARAPNLVVPSNTNKSSSWYEYTAENYGMVRLLVERFGQIDSDPDTWLVGRLRAVIPDHGVTDKLIAAWGEPRRNGRRVQWFDAPNHLRCNLEESDGRDIPKGPMVLDCDYYVPLADLIGSKPGLFGFEQDTPLLGMTRKQVKTQWRRRVFDDGTQIMLPPTEFTFRSTPVRLTDHDAPDEVTWFAIRVSADQKTLDGLLRAKFGPGTDTDGGTVYRAKPRVILVGSEIIVGDKPK